jgi:hypothetical protein
MSPRHAHNHKGTALAVSIFEANLFGPQSKWSSLLGQREHLQNEIARSKRHLEQLRKESLECETVVQIWPGTDKAPGRNDRLERRNRTAANESIEEFLSGWLIHLEEQLAAVVGEIQVGEQQSAVEPICPEESMYELLRAAG